MSKPSTDNSSMSNRPILIDWIKKHLVYMNVHSPFQIHITNLTKSNPTLDGCDCFQLQLPYFSDHIPLTINLFYDGFKIHEPFDFQILCNNNQLLNYFYLNKNQLKYLHEWKENVILNFSNEDLLITFTFKTVMEIINYLNIYFTMIIKNHLNNTIKFEYETISHLNHAKFFVQQIYNDPPNNTTNATNNTPTISEKIYFLLPLENINGFNNLIKENEESFPFIYLQIIFTIENNKLIEETKTDLQFSIALKKNTQFSNTLQLLSHLQLPTFSTNHSCIVEYLPLVISKLEKSLVEGHSTNQLKLFFIQQLILKFGNPIDLVTMDKSIKITFLMHVENYQFLYYLMIIVNTETFPKEMPIVRMQSTKHLKGMEEKPNSGTNSNTSTPSVGSSTTTTELNLIKPYTVRLQQLEWLSGSNEEVIKKNVEKLKTQLDRGIIDFIKLCEK
ncbi:hypothetical protein ABK040_002908 [Willaertia magna]